MSTAPDPTAPEQDFAQETDSIPTYVHVPEAPQPVPRGLRALGLGALGVFKLRDWVHLADPFSIERGLLNPIVTLAFVGAVLLLLQGAYEAIHWLRVRALAQRHPREPWRWDHAWRRELDDEQVSDLRAAIPGLMFVAVFMVIFHLAILSVALSKDTPLLPILVFGGFIVLMDVALYRRVALPYVRMVLALRRFGRTRLHLPRIPLALGGPCEVELEARDSLRHLRHVSVTLRRVTERRSGSGQSTSDDFEYEHTQEVDAAPLREGRNLPIVLQLPPVEEQGSTVLSATPRCRWELVLESKVPGVDLSTRFLLPVYALRTPEV